MDKTDNLHGVYGLSVSEFRLLSFESKVNHIFYRLPDQFRSKDFECSRYMALKVIKKLKEAGLITVSNGRDTKGRFTGTTYTKVATLPQEFSGIPIPVEGSLFQCSVQSEISSVHSVNAVQSSASVDAQGGCDTDGIFGGEGWERGQPPTALPLKVKEESSQEPIKVLWYDYEEETFKEDEIPSQEQIQARIEKYILENANKPKKVYRANRLPFEIQLDRIREEDELPLTYNIPKERACWKRLVTNYGEPKATELLIYNLRTIRLMDDWWKTNLDLLPSTITPRVIELIDERMERMYGQSYQKTERIKP